MVSQPTARAVISEMLLLEAALQETQALELERIAWEMREHVNSLRQAAEELRAEAGEQTSTHVQ
jgi:hypothetical protein